jgi:hypothetical protein
MQLKWGTLIDTARLMPNRRSRSMLAAGVMVAASMLIASACQHPTSTAVQRPVVVGVPAKVSQKVDNAQAALVDSMSTLATNYDQAVCQEKGQMTQANQWRQAEAEARLEVNSAVREARSQARRNRGGGPTAEDDGITIIEEAPRSEPQRGGWMCMEAAGEPACVNAAASTVAAKVYRDYIEGLNLNPVTAGDVMEAFAADAKWADQYLVGASDRSQAFRQIEQACREGQSPLSRFFRAGAEYDHPQVRRDLGAVRDDFAGSHQGVCGALPSYYSNVIGELENDLSLRLRTGRCTAPDWQVLWDD